MSGRCKWCAVIIAACFSECSKCNPNRVNHMAAARKKKPVEGGGCLQEEADYWKDY